MARSRPLRFPPEPLRFPLIEITRRSTEHAELHGGSAKSSGATTTMHYTAKQAGVATSLVLAEASGGWPNQAYVFSAVVAEGTLPKTVSAAEHHVAKTVQLGAGDTFTLELPGNATTGYTWAVSPLAVASVIEPVGDIAFAAGSSDLMGASGVFTAQFKAVAAGSVPLIMLYQGPARVRKSGCVRPGGRVRVVRGGLSPAQLLVRQVAREGEADEGQHDDAQQGLLEGLELGVRVERRDRR